MRPPVSMARIATSSFSRPRIASLYIFVFLSDSVLKCRAGARVGAVPHRYVVVKKPDDVPEGDVAVHSLGSVAACGHVGEVFRMFRPYRSRTFRIDIYI